MNFETHAYIPAKCVLDMGYNKDQGLKNDFGFEKTESKALKLCIYKSSWLVKGANLLLTPPVPCTECLDGTWKYCLRLSCKMFAWGKELQKGGYR